MALKRVWMSSDTGNYLLRVLGGSLGIVLLAVLLVGGGTVLSFRLNWPREAASLLLCAGVTALAVLLALRLRRKALQDVTAFFLTEDDRLYALDARRLSGYGHGVVGYAAGTAETQKLLSRLARMPCVPAGADEVLKVERCRDNRTYYAVICRVRHPSGRVIRRPYFLVKGISEEELLLRELERRETWELDLEPAEDRNPFFIFLSALALVCAVTLCVLSHPAAAKLPQSLYFPCLGAAFLAVVALVWCIVRQSRGE